MIQFIIWTLAIFAAVQGVLVLAFVFRLHNFRRRLIQDADAPRAAVILCLRGGDPFLRECLTNIQQLDYPNYEVHIVVDRPGDPAEEILREVRPLEGAPPIQLQFLQNPVATCSLKCSSLVQAVRSLDESVDFIALLDADTVPHASWLRELATGLADENVGAVTGNRWYMPREPSMGSLVRYAWNAAAIVQMYAYNIAWGGTLAIKTKVIRDLGLLDKWSNAFCEDTMTSAQLRQAGLRLRFVPALMMVNREDCDLSGFYLWVRRQLLTARLYHPAWLSVVGHGLLSTLIPLGTLASAAYYLWHQAYTSAALLALGLVVYHAILLGLLVPMELAVRRILRARQEQSEWITATTLRKTILVIVLTQVFYARALFSACFLRQVDWRGVSYNVHGPWQIELIEYLPYEPTVSDPAVSL